MTRRAFLAITLPPEAAASVVNVRENLRPQLEGVRWVRDEGLHLTLRYFADLPDDRLEQLTPQLHDALGSVRAFPVQLGGVGVFPTESQPRVLWIGLEAGAAALGNLFFKVDVAASEAGLGREPQPFRPHCTIGRFRDPRAGTQLPVIDAAVPAFEVGAVDLYESRGGYHLMERFPLLPERHAPVGDG